MAAKRLSLVVGAWAAAAALFAWNRPPYDDEWFSITLARDLDPSRFLLSLSADLHPPWLPFLDRALVHALPDPRVLALARIVPTAGAIVLVATMLARQLRAPAWLLALASFHPVILMYGATARWYPAVFLAQALRAWALWGGGARRSATAAFAAGALLGPASGYSDFLFLGIDSIFWLHRERAARRTGAALALLGAIALAVAACFVASPLFLAHRALLGLMGAERFSLTAAATWAFTGLLGEAHLAWPFLLVCLLALPGFALALAKLPGRGRRDFALWLGAAVVGWLFLAREGAVASGRYSLLPWLVATASVLGLLWSGRKAERITAATTLGYLVLALCLTLGGRSFLKADLNRMSASECGPLIGEEPPDLVVAVYPQTAWQLVRLCATKVPIAVPGWIRHYWIDGADELAPVRGALAGHARVRLVKMPLKGASLDTTTEHVTSLLAGRCSLESTVHVGQDPHLALKRRFAPGLPAWRYQAESWLCPAK